MRANRRATILFAVLIVVTIASLIGTTAMYLGEAGVSSQGVSVRRMQSRALVWSGVQAAMAELAEQRDKLLDGHPPVLTGQWDLYADDNGTRGVIRLAAIGPTAVEDGRAGTAVSETAKLDLNSATAEMLAKIDGIDPSLAKAIVAARDQRRFSSVEDLLRIKGITAEVLHGGDRDTSTGAASSGTPGAAALADLLTVFSFDPNIQAGLGPNGSDHRGNLRINLATPWSDRLAGAIDERFGEGTAAAVKGLINGGAKFKTLSDVATAARTAGLKPADWAPALDVFTVSDDPYLLGRVDLNLAPAAVLAAIPGISKAAADQIVQARDKVELDARRSVAWPASEGILSAEDFAKAVDFLTTRSLQWRVRVEAGLVRREESQSGGRDDRAALGEKVILEAVIDVSSERPRLTYVRDVTLLDAARAMRSTLAAVGGKNLDAADLPGLAEPPAGATGPTGLAAADQHPAGRNLELSAGMDKGFGGLNLGEMHLGSPIEEAKPEEGGAEGAPVGPPSPDAGDAKSGGGQGAGVDRRLGRWTSGKSGGPA